MKTTVVSILFLALVMASAGSAHAQATLTPTPTETATPSATATATATATPTLTMTPTATATPGTLYAEWRFFSFGPKASVATAITDATVANLVSVDAPAVTLTGNAYVTAQLAAAKTAALAIVASMTGPAPNVKVEITGYSDANAVAPLQSAAANRLAVSVTERW